MYRRYSRSEQVKGLKRKAYSLFIRLESGSSVWDALTLRTSVSEETRRMFKAPQVVFLFTTRRTNDRSCHFTGGKAEHGWGDRCVHAVSVSRDPAPSQYRVDSGENAHNHTNLERVLQILPRFIKLVTFVTEFPVRCDQSRP